MMCMNLNKIQLMELLKSFVLGRILEDIYKQKDLIDLSIKIEEDPFKFYNGLKEEDKLELEEMQEYLSKEDNLEE